MKIPSCWPLLAGAWLFVACGDDAVYSTNPFQDFEDEQVTVVNADESVPIASGEVTGDGCFQITADQCVEVVREGKYCKADSGPVDVIVANGQVVETICYEDTDDTQGPTIVRDADSDGDLDIPQNANNAVLTFDPSTDGTPIEGNITVDSNNTTVYGNGPDKTIIDGNLIISGNNARVRGVRVKGNVVIEKNTAAIVFSVIEGNLHIVYNNSLAAENQVFGNIEVDGNNVILVNNGVAGNLNDKGAGTVCDGNYTFADVSEDFIVQTEERGDPISCGN